MSEGRLGMVIVGSPERIEGVVTDGDLRRALLKNSDTSQLRIPEMMTREPVIIDKEEYIIKAEELMIGRKITTVLVGSESDHIIRGVYQIYSGGI